MSDNYRSVPNNEKKQRADSKNSTRKIESDIAILEKEP